MPFNPNKPAPGDPLIAEDIRENFRALKEDRIVDADKVDGYDASAFVLATQVGNSSGQIPVSNGIVCTNLNADKVDGYDASAFVLASQVGNSSGQIPISNSQPCINLNADMVDGQHLGPNADLLVRTISTNIQHPVYSNAVGLKMIEFNLNANTNYVLVTGEFRLTSPFSPVGGIIIYSTQEYNGCCLFYTLFSSPHIFPIVTESIFKRCTFQYNNSTWSGLYLSSKSYNWKIIYFGFVQQESTYTLPFIVPASSVSNINFNSTFNIGGGTYVDIISTYPSGGTVLYQAYSMNESGTLNLPVKPYSYLVFYKISNNISSNITITFNYGGKTRQVTLPGNTTRTYILICDRQGYEINLEYLGYLLQ